LKNRQIVFTHKPEGVPGASVFDFIDSDMPLPREAKSFAAIWRHQSILICG